MPIQSILIYLSLGLHTPYLPVGGWSKLHSGVIRSYHFILFGRYTVYPFTCFKFAGQLPQRFFFFFWFLHFRLGFPPRVVGSDPKSCVVSFFGPAMSEKKNFFFVGSPASFVPVDGI